MVSTLCSWPVPRWPQCPSVCLVPGWCLHFVLGPSLAGLNVRLIVLFQDGVYTLFLARPSLASMYVWLSCSRMVSTLCSWPVPRWPQCPSDCLVPGWCLHFVLGPSLAGLNVRLIVLFQDGVYTLFLARPSLASMSVCSSITRSTQNRGQTETPTTRYNGRTTARRRWMFTITMQRCRYALPGPSTTTLHWTAGTDTVYFLS